MQLFALALGICVLALLMMYKVNYLLFLPEKVPLNPFVVIKKTVGLFVGLGYFALLILSIFVLQLHPIYILVIDLFLTLLLLAYIDWKYKIIPNRLNAALLLSQLACVYLIAGDRIGILNLVFSGLLLAVLAFLSYKTAEAFGMGDIKLLVVVNCIYGLSYILYTAIFAMLLIILTIIPLLIMKKANLKTGIPFAPFYLAGTAVYYIFNLIL